MNKPRILVVEDEALIAANLVNVLTSLGYTVPGPVATGEDAIRAVKTQKPDLVLMDIVLIGEMNGIVAAEKIRAIADIPLVYLTAYTDDLHLKQAQITEPYGYIVKPIDSRELNATIEMVLYRHALDRKLKESEERYRTLVTSVDEAIIFQEKTGEILTWNRAAERLFGVTAGEVLGHTATSRKWKTIREDGTEFPDSEHPSTHTLETGEACKNVVMGITSTSGGFFWVSINTSPLIKNGEIKPYAVVISFSDITERKRAEESLRESEMSLKEAQRVGHLGSWDLNVVTGDLQWSDECYHIYGFRPQEFVPTYEKFRSIVHPEDLGFVQEQVDAALDNDKQYDVDFRFVQPNEEIGWIHCEGEVTRDAEGKPLHFFGTQIDITKRKQAEKMLRESEEKYRELANSITDIFFALDQNLLYTFWNKASEKLTGIAAQDAIGKTIYEIFSDTPETLRAVEVYRDVLRTHQPRRFVNEHYLGGKHLFFEIDAYPSAGGIAVFTKDITDRKLAEKQIKDSEARFKDLFNNMGAGVAVYEPVGDGDDFIFRDINNAAEKIDKVRREDTVGRSVLEIFPGVKEYGLFDVFQRVWRTGVPEQHPISQYRDNRISGWRNNYVYKLPSGEIVAIYEDVTDKKLAEEALRETEETFKAVAENANDGILIAVGEGAHTFANRRASEITGYSIAELLKTSIMDLTAPDEVKNLMEKFRKRLSGKDVSQQYETVIIRKDGKSVTIEFTAAKTLWHGQPADLVIIRDITERKQAEEALQENQKRFQALTETTNDFVWEMDANGVYTYCSPQINELWGYKPEDMIGRSPFDLMIPEDRKHAIEMFRTISESPISFKGMETSSLDNTGRIVVLETSGVPFFDIDGRLCGYRGISRDITARKQAEVALHESEERYSILADAEHDAIYSVNPEGVVTFVNSGGAALIGMPPEKIVGLSLESLYDPDSAEEFRENLDTVISTKRPVRFDSKFWHENPDQITWLDAQLVPQFGPDGSVVQVIGISRSITDRKQAEMLLKRFNVELEWQVRLRTAELEHTNSLLEAAIIQRTLAEESIRKSLNERELLLREIHHRVRNNLQIILSLISLQSRNIKDQKVLDTMGEFQNRIMAMAHVHERMCRADDISRIDLSEIVTFLGASLFKSYKVNPQHIRLNVEMQALQITIDSAIPISLIINELVSNSIKHAFPKGTMGEITIAGRREADKLVLSVRDTGIGIPADIDWMRSKQSLGHRLVVSLVEQLQGTIELDRTTGSVFNIVVKEKQ